MFDATQRETKAAEILVPSQMVSLPAGSEGCLFTVKYVMNTEYYLKLLKYIILESLWSKGSARKNWSRETHIQN